MVSVQESAQADIGIFIAATSVARRCRQGPSYTL